MRNLKNREQQAGLHSPDLTTLDNKLGGVTQINAIARNGGYLAQTSVDRPLLGWPDQTSDQGNFGH